MDNNISSRSSLWSVLEQQNVQETEGRVASVTHVECSCNVHSLANCVDCQLCSSTCSTVPARPESSDSICAHSHARPFATLPSSPGQSASGQSIGRLSSAAAVATVCASWAVMTARITNSDEATICVAMPKTLIGGVMDLEGNGVENPERVAFSINVTVRNTMTVSAFLGTIECQIRTVMELPLAIEARVDQMLRIIEPGSFTALMDIDMPNDLEGLTGSWSAIHGQSGNEPEQLVHLGWDTKESSSHFLEPWVLQRLPGQLRLVASRLCGARPGDRLSGVHMATAEDLRQLWTWNRELPVTIERRLHDLFYERVQQDCGALAVSAWDGQLTYGELDALATQLAKKLHEVGVASESLVPLYFEKSMWATVALLGVLKTGAGFVLLDPSIPKRRLRQMVQQSNARLIIASRSMLDVGRTIADTVIPLDYSTIKSVTAKQQRPVKDSSSPYSVAYVTFTSGSTGRPKGVKITHSNAVSALHHQSQLLCLTTHSKVYDFASYSFDVSINNILTTLTAGGCLCVPSDNDRKNNLQQSIACSGANTLDITPSVAQLLTPSKLPEIKTVILSGEPLRLSDVQRWWGRALRVHHAYGPSECTPTSTINAGPSSPEQCVPIGKGSGAITWVVNPENENEILPPGYIGELLLEGPIVGPGYLVKDRVTPFLEDPPWLLHGTDGQPGRHGRLYKTGDLVRYCDDGNLVFISRKDSQVKIRGQRVELAEVEHIVQLCVPQARQVVAEVIVPQKSRATAPILAVFLELEQGMRNPDGSDASLDPAATTNVMHVPDSATGRMLDSLPSYMVPQIFIRVPRIPVTVSGKTDRKRLRLIGESVAGEHLVKTQTNVSQSVQQPTSEVEKQLQSAWSRSLNVDVTDIGLHDSFLRLGGDSIAAMQASSLARSVSIDIGVEDILREKTISNLVNHISASTTNPNTDPQSDEPPVGTCSSGIAQHVRGTNSVAEYATKNIANVQSEGTSEQSSAQTRLWYLDRLYPGRAWYLVPSAVRLKGRLQIEALSTALLAMVYRHETLRTTFSSTDGFNLQHVQPFEHKQLRVIDVSSRVDEVDVMDILMPDLTTPFNLEVEPGFRTTLYRCGENDHVLCVVVHHIVYDGWSADILRRELTIFYSHAIRGANPFSVMEPLPIQYRDYSAWEKALHHDRQSIQRRQLDYWLSQLEAARPAELLCDKPRPEALSGQAKELKLQIQGSLYRSLQNFCRKLEVTPFVVLLTAFRATHFRLTGVSDATIGAANANRNQWELKDMIGFFVNLQCIRIKLQDESFEQLTRQVQETMLAALSNHEVPFDRIVSKLQVDRRLSRHPLVQIAFAMHSQVEIGEFAFEGVETESLTVPPVSRFDIEFHVYRELEAFQLEVLFSTDLYEPGTISNMLSVFHEVLQRGITDAATPILKLPLFNDTVLSLMSQFKMQKSNYPRHSSIVDVFRQQVATNAGRVAVVDSEHRLTYSQLEKQSNAVARWLHTRLLPAETVVGVFAARSCEATVAFMGILKANLAYLPLDTKTPAARIQTTLSLASCQLVLVGQESVPGPPASHQNAHSVQLVPIADILLQQPSASNAPCSKGTYPAPSATSLAYIMFTSGTTGEPKGVMVEHRSIVRLMKNSNFMQHLPVPAKVAHISNIAFDMATAEIYAPLLNGGTVVCIGYEDSLEPAVVSKIFAKENVNVLAITPALLKSYLSACPATISALDVLVVGGDRADVQDMLSAGQLVKGAVLNGYGPTENTVFSTIHPLSPEDSYTNGVPIGRAITNSGAFVMDPDQRLVPVGVIGELVVTGDGLARGYINPEHANGRFISITVDGEQIRAYRTGDYARYRPIDGQLEFMGRIDRQVKIRGHRVELREIELILRAHDSVGDVAVVLTGGTHQDARIAAFITLRDDAEAQLIRDKIHDTLRRMLPSYMVPHTVTVMAQMPINAHGKVDRHALKDMPPDTSGQRSINREPLSEAELELRRIWAKVLNLEPDTIGIEDGFFQLGGDSITAMQVASAAKASNIDISPADILQMQSISRLAAKPTVLQEQVICDSRNAQCENGEPFELSPVQQLYAQFEPNFTYCLDQAFLLKLRATVPVEAVREAIEGLVLRHSMLRARFSRRANGEWQQRVTNDVIGSYHFQHLFTGKIDEPSSIISGCPTKDVRDFQMKSCRERLDIENGPLVAATLFLDSATRVQNLFIACHHLVIDLVSWRIIFRDLEDFLTKGAFSVPPSTSFQTWCTEQRTYASESLFSEPASIVSIPQPFLSYWGLDPSNNLRVGATTREFLLDKASTAAIIRPCEVNFDARPVDLMIAALVHSFCRIFTDRPVPAVFNEGHGRETFDNGLDVTHTVGWFTTVYPVYSPSVAGLNLRELISEISAQSKRLPNNGWSHFTARFADRSAAATNVSDFPVEIMLNFAGIYQQLERDDSLFQNLPLSDACEAGTYLQLRRLAIFEVFINIEDGQLTVRFTQPEGISNAEKVTTWIAQYREVLLEFLHLDV